MSCTNSNTVLGCQNFIDETTVTASVAEGKNNKILSGIANHIEGQGNVINSDNNPTSDASENNHVEGLDNTVGGYQNSVNGANHTVNGFQSSVVGVGNFTTNNRAGQNISGFGGHFLYDASKTFGEDINNYSNQLAGGIVGGSEYPGEGISMVDKTLANGIYPIGQHQAYRNTSDGLSYSVMLKGKEGLKEGTFVTFGDCKHKERLIERACDEKEVVGVITKSSGFIANAGQFPASGRIKYDVFGNPIIKINTDKSEDHYHPVHENIIFPGHQTVLKDGVDRKVPFVPYTEREEYYQVALSGLVVVRAKDVCEIGKKCDVENGFATHGRKYWVVKILDNKHIMILLQ